MRADLPPAVARAIEQATGPALVFDRARIEANLRAVAVAARGIGATALFAAKAFPHPAVWAAAAELLDGFDAGSPGELAALPAARVVSIADPTGRAAAEGAARAARVIASCETADQVRAAPPRAEIAIRISASLLGRDPAIGAIERDGHHRSRFGLDGGGLPAGIAALAAAAAGRPVGLHVHHGPITATAPSRFVATAEAVLAAAAAAGVTPAFLDLGGAWHALPDLAAALAAIRAAVPHGIELILEPGRAISREAGFGCGRVVGARALDDRALRVTELSRICHLRWSPIELVGAAPRPGEGRALTVVGPTCFEDDALGTWTAAPDTLPVGARAIVRHVTGYAVGWNHGFGGVPAAGVVLA